MQLPESIVNQIQNEYGLDCSILGQPTIQSLTNRRMEACSLQKHKDYYQLLENSNTEFHEFSKSLLVPETWFFRDGTPFKWLESWLKDQHPSSRKLKALSIPCATGEEAYSIAMCFKNASWEKDYFSVTGIDINDDFLKKAIKGKYTLNSFRGKQPINWDSHFDINQPRELSVNPEIKACVSFKKANLIDPFLLRNEGSFDIIFMRNVLIYFSESARQKAIQNIKRILNPEGLLFIGHADNILTLSEDFESFGEASSFLYRKKKKLLKRHTAFPQSSNIKKILKSHFVDQNNSKKTSTKHLGPVSFSKIKPLKKNGQKISVASELINNGNISEAKNFCEFYIQSNPMDPEGYFTLGQAHAAELNIETAEQYYRKALFIQHNHLASLQQLELILKINGRKEEASLIRIRHSKSQQFKQ